MLHRLCFCLAILNRILKQGMALWNFPVIREKICIVIGNVCLLHEASGTDALLASTLILCSPFPTYVCSYALSNTEFNEPKQLRSFFYSSASVFNDGDGIMGKKP